MSSGEIKKESGLDELNVGIVVENSGKKSLAGDIKRSIKDEVESNLGLSEVQVKLDKLFSKFFEDVEKNPVSAVALQDLVNIEEVIKEQLKKKLGRRPMNSEIDQEIVDEIEIVVRKVVGDKKYRLDEHLEKPTLSNLIEFLANRIRDFIGELDLADEFKTLSQLGVDTVQVDRPVLIPDSEFKPIKKRGVDDEEIGLSSNKLSIIIKLLRDFNIFPEDIFAVVETRDKNMFRKNNYVYLVVPRLNRSIFVNLGKDEATFVLNVADTDLRFTNFTKKQIIELGGKKIIYFESDKDKYIEDLRLALFEDSDFVKVQDNTFLNSANLKAVPFDLEYFSSKERVAYDLEQFFLTAKVEHPTHLSVYNARDYVRCSNGEVLKFDAYLRRAGKALGIMNNSEEFGKVYSVIREHLFVVAGYILRNKEYFENPEIVSYDLEQFRKLHRVDEINQLAQGQSKEYATIYNGEKMQFRSYIQSAGKELGIAKSTGEANKVAKLIKESLFKLVGASDSLRTFGYLKKFGLNYFNDVKNVREDLENFAKANGLETAVLLKMNMPEEIITKKGVEVSLLQYVRAFIYVFEKLSKDKKFESEADALKHMLKFAGFIVRDEDYFRNSEFIRADLLSFLGVCNLSDPNKLSVVNCNRGRLFNGEELGFSTYLGNAAYYLGISQDLAADKEQKVLALKELISIANL